MGAVAAGLPPCGGFGVGGFRFGVRRWVCRCQKTWWHHRWHPRWSTINWWRGKRSLLC